MTSLTCPPTGRGTFRRVFLPFLTVSALFFAPTASLPAAKLPAADTPSDASPQSVSPADMQSIRSAHDRWRHRIESVEDGWQAANPTQQWTTKFDGRGFEAKPRHGKWTWGLELRAYGAGAVRREVGGSPEVHSEGHTLAYHWDQTVQEWFVNDRRGLEHGFSVQERPPGPPEAPLIFVLATRGPLRAEVTRDRLGVDYRDASNATVLTYSGLRVWDADGRALEARFEAAQGGVELQVQADGARYPVTIDPLAQQAYLKPFNTGVNDQFGTSVAVSGDTVVIGAPGEDSNATQVNGDGSNNDATNSGAAYVFVRTSAGWTQQAYLKASNAEARDFFGRAVAISGDTIVVGAPCSDTLQPGAAYVFVRNATGWTQQAHLTAPDAATDAQDLFGNAVAVSGNTIVVGAPAEAIPDPGADTSVYEDAAVGFNAGAAYVFLRNGASWTQQVRLTAPVPEHRDFFGGAVAISGNTIVVGAPCFDKLQPGAAYVFTSNGDSPWSLQQDLQASNSGDGDRFGGAVDISGDTLVVGANGEASSATGVNPEPDTLAPDSGAAYVFVRDEDDWTQQAYLKASNTEEYDYFGLSVAISADTIVVGASEEDSAEQGVNGDESDNSAEYAGAAYVFVRDGDVWTQQSYLKASNVSVDGSANFGNAVAVSGQLIVVGAPGEDSNAGVVNGNQSDTSAADSGAAYVFDGPPIMKTSLTASGRVGQSFSYQIPASGLPSAYTARDLPAGLSVNTTTGRISGKPTKAGTFNVTVSATNGAGTEEAPLTLSIAKGTQTISFNPAKVQKFRKGRTFTLTATSTSKLPVTFKITKTSKPKILSIKGNKATIRGQGKVTITASQGGNANYSKAKPITRTITIR